jgi:serine/threonine protein kinase
VSRSGYRFPPFLALDRGITLTDWLEEDRLASAVLAMAGEVVELLALLHNSGHVHRDLKPENLLFVFNNQKWRLIDFGIVTPTGLLLWFFYPCLSPRRHVCQ